MLKYVKNVLANRWQGRFQYGFGFSIGSIGLTRHKYGVVLMGNGPMVLSPGTGHWPWYMFEFGVAGGAQPSWHIGVLGLTVGMQIEHCVNEEGMVDGPDFKKYYWFFKGLNHQSKELGEII